MKQLTDNIKKLCLETLLFIACHDEGVSEGIGGKRSAGYNGFSSGESHAGTGLRAPNAPLWNVKAKDRNLVLSTLLECGCVEMSDDIYKVASRGAARLTKEQYAYVVKLDHYRVPVKSIITYEQLCRVNDVQKGDVNGRKYEVLKYFAPYEEYKRDFLQEIKDGKRDKFGWPTK